MINYGRHDINQDDIDEVVKTLSSDYITQGPQVPKFENNIAKFTKSEYATVTNSATSALHLTCLGLGLGIDDYLWTSPISFVASANCGLYCNAKVDFVDIDINTFNINIDSLERKLKAAKKKKKLPKILVVVHMAGQPANMQAIGELSSKFKFYVIEDASHAIGAEYENNPVGNCKYSKASIFSFHPVKIITTGEGGAITTNDKILDEQLKSLRSHGITKNSKDFLNSSDGPWYYEQKSLGFNYRMSDIQASLGISQLKRIKEIVKKRNEIAERYNSSLKNIQLVTPYIADNCYSSFHLYIIKLKIDELKPNSHRKIFEFLISKGINVNLHYIPIYRQPYYSEIGYKYDDFPNAEEYYKKAITLPLYPGLSEENQDIVMDLLIEALNLCKL